MSQTLVPHKSTKLYLSAAIVLIAVSGWAMASRNTKKRQQQKKTEALSKQSIDHQTNIFAFEPQNLFLRLRSEQHKTYKPLKRAQGSLLDRMRSIFKRQPRFYEQKISGKQLRKIFKQLKRQANVKLMIYTQLQKQFLAQILDDFGITPYFEHNQLVIMQNEHKSAEEIDHLTKRVVIISANKEDRNESILGSNQKLILNIPENEQIELQTLDKLQRFLTKLAATVQIDSLHEQMHQLAIEMDLPLLNDQI